MQDRKFLITGLARNCASTIAVDVQRIAKAVGPANWFVVESDSDDDSIARLEQTKANTPGFRYVSLGRLRATIPNRIDRIAHCRNRYLQEISENPDYGDVDYVVVADFDNLNLLISKEAVQSCFERDDWDVCAANQRGPYYDIFALRHPVWSPSDCLVQFRQLMRGGMSEGKALLAAVYSKMMRIDEDADWISVSSAFGGFAVYRRSVLGVSRYSGRNGDGVETCEHVPFHEALGARILINPRLINAGYTEHSNPLRFPYNVRLNAKILAKYLIRMFWGARAIDTVKSKLSVR